VHIWFDAGTNDTIGAVKVRYEIKTTYAPEPSAALSLTIGVLGLAGLAAMKQNGEGTTCEGSI